MTTASGTLTYMPASGTRRGRRTLLDQLGIRKIPGAHTNAWNPSDGGVQLANYMDAQGYGHA